MKYTNLKLELTRTVKLTRAVKLTRKQESHHQHLLNTQIYKISPPHCRQNPEIYSSVLIGAVTCLIT